MLSFSVRYYIYLAIILFGFAPATAAAQSITVPAQLNVLDAGQYNLISDFGAAISISGMDQVVVQLSIPQGNLKITATAGLTPPSGANSADWVGASSIAFQGSLADVNSALASLSVQGGDQIVTITASAPDTVFFAQTGHSYQYVNTAEKWEDAKQIAMSRSIGGNPGYLVTILSQAELTFLLNNFSWTGNIWAGGSDSANENNWLWDGGAGPSQLFFFGRAGGMVQPGYFANWGPNQPNNHNEQDYLGIKDNGLFYDHGANSSFGYIIEYSGSVSTTQSFMVSLTAVQTAGSGDLQQVKANIKTSLDSYFSQNLRQNLTASTRTQSKFLRAHRPQADRKEEQPDLSPLSNSYFIDAQSIEGQLQGQAHFSMSRNLDKGTVDRIEIDISHLNYAHEKATTTRSFRFIRKQNLDTPIAKHYFLRLADSRTKNTYQTNSTISSEMVGGGVGLSRKLAEGVFGLLATDAWYSQTRLKYADDTASAKGDIAHLGYLASARIEGGYALSDAVFMDMMFSFVKSRETLQKQQIMIA